MAKTKKKRRQVKTKRPTNDVQRIRRVSAVVRPDWQQWLVDHKSLIKRIGLIALALIVILAGIIALFK